MKHSQLAIWVKSTADDEGTEIVLGEPLQFTPDNVADYAKLY